MRRVGAIVALLALVTPGRGAERIELAWPTPSTAWAEGRGISSFLQHAGSGDAASGGFGGVRSGGTQFHEGIDIRALRRDRRGEPLDTVRAAMDGIIRYINPTAGDSSYGRYIVLEHPLAVPMVYTLYAHLARVTTGLSIGERVARGETIGIMGHSSGGYTIPKARAHLHFEIGLAVTRDFQSWYDRLRFGSRNEHGMWNGMNLVGIDPLEFFTAWRARRVQNFAEFFAAMEPVVTIRIATRRVPDFVTRYPALLTKPLPAGIVAGWQVRFNWSGVPFAWTPLDSRDVAGLAPNRPDVLDVNAAVERRERSRSLAVYRRGEWQVGPNLETVLEQLFALR